ncbi:hypothetical protein L9F63_004309, partial [Diploptera punctata]
HSVKYFRNKYFMVFPIKVHVFLKGFYYSHFIWFQYVNMIKLFSAFSTGFCCISSHLKCHIKAVRYIAKHDNTEMCVSFSVHLFCHYHQSQNLHFKNSTL